MSLSQQSRILPVDRAGDSATSGAAADRRPTSLGDPRRVARTVPARSTSGVLAHLVRVSLDPGWTPLASARRLVDHVQGDQVVLRRARMRLRGAMGARIGVTQARALATLVIAIAELEEATDGPRRVRQGAGRSGT